MKEKKPYGLVVCGGNSTRMVVDKSTLVYHELPQRDHVYQLLQHCCDAVFISCNDNQLSEINRQLNSIVDDEKYAHNGPIAAVLSAFSKFPDRDFLIAGCDYPFIRLADLEMLTVALNGQPAAAFYRENEHLYEPLLAYYSYKCFPLLEEFFSAGNLSLQAFLKNVQASKCLPSRPMTIKSIDTKADYLMAKQQIALMKNDKLG